MTNRSNVCPLIHLIRFISMLATVVSLKKKKIKQNWELRITKKDQKLIDFAALKMFKIVLISFYNEKRRSS